MPALKIPASELRPGMYVVDTGVEWSKAPFLYSREGVIRDQGQIAEILEQGFTEVYYDPEQSRAAQEETVSFAKTAPVAVKGPSVALAEEMPVAEQAYTDCVKHARSFMQAVHDGGTPQIAQIEPLITGMIGSLNRNVDALTSLAKVKRYDEYTFEHCVNVAIFATAFGRFLGMGEQDLLLLGIAGITHDAGKMRVPQEILNAPRRLNDEEFAIMKTHVRLGLEYLERDGQLPEVALLGVGQHHEKHSGAGYPNGLVGQKICRFGRILSVADVYDALTAKRVYKDPLPPPKALSIMFGMRGDSWEPGLVELFIKMLGIYPVGTPVLLSSGHKAVVSQSNPSAPLTPTVRVVADAKGAPLPTPREISLARVRDITISRALQPSECEGIDCACV